MRAPPSTISPSPTLYLAVGLEAGAVIALQICIMRIYAVGSWAHFGSMVVSLAMLGFGLTSAVICISKPWFEAHWRGAVSAALLAFGPMMIASNLIAQQIPFNAIFLVSDPMQKWRLAANFILYMLPFLCGAFFLGIVFLKARMIFGRVYFADLVGSGLCGFVFLGAMYVFRPENLIVVPLLLWLCGAMLWFRLEASLAGILATLVAAIASLALHVGLPRLVDVRTLSTSDYKGVAYARKFPDSQRIYERASPFGYIEVYGSSYLHFAPGLSDNAAFNLPEMPANAYLGLYVDGEGPSGIIRHLPPEKTAYFRFLPMIYPYLLKEGPRTFVVQFGGGISTALALRGGSQSVTVAESNPAILAAFRTDRALREFTGDILNDPKVTVIDHDGRLYLASTSEKYDVIDLSLADSAGLSSPGGFAIVEKFAYTREAMVTYMSALRDEGILSVTLWNKEEPPKSVLKLYATMAAAAREFEGGLVGDRFFVVGSYLSTTTVLYKRGGFTPADTEKLRVHTRAMSFDEIYAPGLGGDPTATAILDDYRRQIFSDALPGDADKLDLPADTVPNEEGETTSGGAPTETALPSTMLGRLAWLRLIDGSWQAIADRYAFDTRILTSNRPYFAAYIRPVDLPRVLDRLELVQDEWGYLLIWATLAIACIAASSLIALPLVFGWRAIFSANRGKFRTIGYFACLGLGYIMVEVCLISKFVLAMGNAAVAAGVVLTGMLVASGLGSLVSERFVASARSRLPPILVAIAVLLALYSLLLGWALDWLGTLPFILRIAIGSALIFPPAFLMGFPMPLAMTSLADLGKDHMFVWAWGINGCCSVVGAALVPIVSTSLGLTSVLHVAAVLYVAAIPAFLGVILPMRRSAVGAGR